MEMSHFCNSQTEKADRNAGQEEIGDARPGLLRASSHLQFFLQLLVLLGLGEALLLLQMVGVVQRLQLGAVGAVLLAVLAVLVVALAVGGGRGRGGRGGRGGGGLDGLRPPDVLQLFLCLH